MIAVADKVILDMVAATFNSDTGSLLDVFERVR